MGLIDIIILILIVAGLLIGYSKGLIGQLSTICGIVLGIIVCHIYGDWATNILTTIIPESATWPMPEYTPAIIANIVLFLLVLLTIKLMGSMCKSVINKLHIGILDNLAGAVFCVFKYLLLLSIVINVAYVIAPGAWLNTSGSVVQRITVNLAPALLGVDSLPRLLEDINDSLEKNKD